MADENADSSIHDGVLTYTINLLRVAAGQRQKVLSMLEALESKLAADVQQVVGKSPQTIARLQALLKQTTASIQASYKAIQKQQQKALTSVAKTTADHQAKIQNAELKVPLVSVGQTEKQLEAIAGKALVMGRYPSEWWKGQDKALRDKFAAEMRLGMLKGETVQQLVQRVRGTKAKGYTDGIMQVSKAQATSLVRTSVQTVANEARVASIRANPNINKAIQWVSTLDLRTSLICRALDNLRWELEGLKPLGHGKVFPGPIAHWQCRSTQIGVTKGWAEIATVPLKLDGKQAKYEEILTKKMEAAGMAPAAIAALIAKQKKRFDGKGVEGTLTMTDWLKGKSDQEIDDILGPGRGELYRSGKINLQQLTDQNSRPLTLAELRVLAGLPPEPVPPEPEPINLAQELAKQKAAAEKAAAAAKAAQEAAEAAAAKAKAEAEAAAAKAAAEAAAAKAAAEAAAKKAAEEAQAAALKAQQEAEAAKALAKAQAEAAAAKAAQEAAAAKLAAEAAAAAKAKKEAEEKAAFEKLVAEQEAAAKAQAEALAAQKAAAAAAKAKAAADKLAAELAEKAALEHASAQAEIAEIVATGKPNSHLNKALAKVLKEQPQLPPQQALQAAKAAEQISKAKEVQQSQLKKAKQALLEGKPLTPAQQAALDTLAKEDPQGVSKLVAAVNAEKQAAQDAAAKAAADAAAALAAQQAAAANAVKAAQPKPKPAAPPPAPPATPAAPGKPQGLPPGLPPRPADFPADPTKLKLVKVLGGSTGAELVEDEQGRRFVRKTGGNPGHVREENTADHLYRSLGVDVPEGHLYETPGGPVKLARFIEGETLQAFESRASASQKKAIHAKLREGFAADALMGNWDVLGASRDNVLVGKDGRVWRIDNGGSLRYRAMGAQKLPADWTPFASELWTMRAVYDTPTLQALQKNIPAKVQGDFREVFAEADIFQISRQVEGWDVQALLATAPPEIRAVIEPRLENMRALATRALDFEHTKWTPAASDQVAKYSMELRQQGIVAQMSKRFTVNPASPTQLLDENGKAFDELRTGRTGGAGTPTAAATADPFAHPFLDAIISVNAHYAKGSTAQFANPAKVQQVLGFEAALKAHQQSGTPQQKALAAIYLPWIDKIKAAQAAWKPGQGGHGPAATKLLPQFEVSEGAQAVAKIAVPAIAAPARPGQSLTAQVAAYIESLGGKPEAVRQWQQSQAGDSWNDQARAMKHWVGLSHNLDKKSTYWGAGGQKASEKQYDQLAAQMGGHEAVNKTFAAWVAYTQEILDNTASPNKDDKLRAVRLLRTENPDVFNHYGIQRGKYGGEHAFPKGPCESHSLVRIVGVHGEELTVTAVPFSEISGLYWQEKPGYGNTPGSGGAAYAGDGENEITANSGGMPGVYAGNRRTGQYHPTWQALVQPGYDAGADATKWLVPIAHLRRVP